MLQIAVVFVILTTATVFANEPTPQASSSPPPAEYTPPPINIVESGGTESAGEAPFVAPSQRLAERYRHVMTETAPTVTADGSRATTSAVELQDMHQAFLLGPYAVGGGARHTSGVNGAGGTAMPFAVDGRIAFLQHDGYAGAARAVSFQASLLLGENGQPEGMRLRFNLADAEVTYICKHPTRDDVIPPFVSLLRGCKPHAWIGIGVDTFSTQIDTGTGRVVERWLEANVVLNALANGHNLSGMYGRLLIMAGISIENVWPNGALDPLNLGNRFIPRANVGLSTMLRTPDQHWEFRASGNFRPAITPGIEDWAVETRATFMFHFMMGERTFGTIGVEGHYSHWTVPTHSMGTYASDRERNSFYVGLFFRSAFGAQ